MGIQKEKKTVCTCVFLKDEHASSSFATIFSNISKLAKEEYNCVLIGIGFDFFLFFIRLKSLSAV